MRYLVLGLQSQRLLFTADIIFSRFIQKKVQFINMRTVMAFEDLIYRVL